MQEKIEETKKDKKEELDLTQFDELKANTMTRSQLRVSLGDKAYIKLTPFQKKVLCDRYPQKYNAFTWAWNNITIGQLRKQLLHQFTIEDLDMTKVLESRNA